MADQTKYAPVSPYLAVHDGYGALEFYKTAFAAEVRESIEWHGRLGHATLYVNGGEIMLSDESDEAVTGVRSPGRWAARVPPSRWRWTTSTRGSSARWPRAAR